VLLLVLMALWGGLSSHGRASPPAGALSRAIAAALSLIFLVGCVRAIVAGRPWELDRAPELTRVELPDSPWSVAIPRGQTTRTGRGEGTAHEFGNLSHDPSVVGISWVPLSDASSEREPGDELAMIQRQLATVPDGLQQLLPARIVRDEARPERSYVAVRYRYVSNDEVVDDRAIGVVAGTLVRVDVIAWAALPRAYEGLAGRIWRSFEPSAAATTWLGTPSGVFHGVVSPPSDGTLQERSNEPLLAFGAMGRVGSAASGPTREWRPEKGCLEKACLTLP
jgi:hypothetical protein